MVDGERSTEVQKTDENQLRDEEDAVVLPVAGQIGAAAGGLNTGAVPGMAPLVGGAIAFGAARDAGLFEDDDTRVADRVEEALAGDGRVIAADLRIAVAEGTVELTGTVSSPEEKRDAEETCSRVPGVRAVQNNLTVAPAAR